MFEVEHKDILGVFKLPWTLGQLVVAQVLQKQKARKGTSEATEASRGCRGCQTGHVSQRKRAEITGEPEKFSQTWSL